MAPAGRLGEFVESVRDAARTHYRDRDVEWKVVVTDDDRQRPVVEVEVRHAGTGARWTTMDELLLNTDAVGLARHIERGLVALDRQLGMMSA